MLHRIVGHRLNGPKMVNRRGIKGMVLYVNISVVVKRDGVHSVRWGGGVGIYTRVAGADRCSWSSRVIGRGWGSTITGTPPLPLVER